MATASQAISAARQRVGTTEFPANSNCNTFSTHLGRPCEAWCADFLVAILREVGVKIPSESAYTPTMFAGFRVAGMSVPINNVRPGDLVFFDFPDKTTGIQHVGMATTGVNPGGIGTVEGNTSPGILGSQDNGGGVYERTRPLAYIVGVGRPPYSPQAPVGLGAPRTPPGPSVISPVRVDVNLRNISLMIPLDDAGKGWTTIPYTIDRIVGNPVAHSGTRPGADLRYDATPDAVGCTPEDDHTIIVVQGGTPGGSAPVWVTVVEE